MISSTKSFVSASSHTTEPALSLFISFAPTVTTIPNSPFILMSLFERLYHYREQPSKNQRENYLTELLAAILEELPALTKLICEQAGIVVPPATLFRIRTQVRYDQGQPDIVVDSVANGIYLLIECKLEAGEGLDQLERYQDILSTQPAPHKALVFLTKYYEPRPKPVVCLRWHQLYQLLATLESCQLLTLFREYLIVHDLHKTMAFHTADLVALEHMPATIAKMDEVLSPVEAHFRARLGGTFQYTQSRITRLTEGWYGYWRILGSVRFGAGFWCSPGEMPACFISVATADSLLATTEGNKTVLFLEALRQKWGVEDSKLNFLAVSSSVAAFMSTGSGSGEDGVLAMREWFVRHLAQLNDELENYPHIWQADTQANQLPNALVQEQQSDQPVGNPQDY